MSTIKFGSIVIAGYPDPNQKPARLRKSVKSLNISGNLYKAPTVTCRRDTLGSRKNRKTIVKNGLKVFKSRFKNYVYLVAFKGWPATTVYSPLT